MRVYPKAGNALEFMPRTWDLAQSRYDAVHVLNDRGMYATPAAILVGSEEPLPELTKKIVNTSHWDHDPIYVAKLHNAFLIDDRSIITQDFVFLTDLYRPGALHVRHPQDPGNGERMLKAVELGDAEEVASSALVLFFHPSCSGYSHWLVQCAPQLGYLQRAGVNPEYIVVDSSIRDYQYEILEMFGFQRERVIVRHDRRPLRFKELYVGYVDDNVVPDFTYHDQCLSRWGGEGASAKLIYVARTDARYIRRLLNENELIDALRDAGFMIVELSGLTAQQEVSLFSRARCVVGPLGAGIYNIAFTAPASLVVGLSDPHYVMSWLPQLAGLRGHRCGFYFGSGYYSYEGSFRGTHNNWVIDVGAFMDVVLADCIPNS